MIKKVAGSNIFRTMLIMTLIVIGVKLIGFVRESVLAYCYGTSNIADAFIIAFSIPSVLFSALGKAASTTFIPAFMETEKKEGRDRAFSFLTAFCIIGLIICAVIVIVILVFPNFIISIFANGFDAETSLICKDILLVGCSSIFFMLLSNIFVSFIQVRKHYILSAIISLPLNIILIIAIFLSTKFNYIVLGFGILLAYASELILLIPILRKEKFKIAKPTKCGKLLKSSVIAAIPVLIGSCAAQINHMVDKSIASSTGVGGVSILNYSSLVNVSVQELIITSLLSVIFVEFTKLIIDNNIDQLKNQTNKMFGLVCAIMIPVTFGIIYFSEPIIKILFYRGSFDENSLIQTSSCLKWYAIGIFFTATRDIIVKMYYSYKKTLIPAINSIVTIGINIGLNFWLASIMGVYGIALATSISAILSTIFLIITFSRKFFPIINRKLLYKFFICSLTGFLSCLCGSKIFEYTNQNMPYFISLIVGAVIAIVIYMISLKSLKIDDFDYLFSKLFRKVKRNETN
ncbi:MAG: murein biosynthesis integral membrane protein MurJ [Bacilli bacterium]|nr:murein biosynthesis integral membrane protein MurJ [Bacilli bacterium]